MNCRPRQTAEPARPWGRLGPRAGPALVLALVGRIGWAAEVPRNWFSDPYFQITHAVAGCPEPAGPRVLAAERAAESHHRAERGTTCWLAHECDRPSAYAYDQDIAAAIRAQLRRRPPAPGSTLWVTVQGRIVFVAGCVRAGFPLEALVTRLRAVPAVQQVIPLRVDDPTADPPYRLFQPR